MDETLLEDLKDLLATVSILTSEIANRVAKIDELQRKITRKIYACSDESWNPSLEELSAAVCRPPIKKEDTQ